MIRRLILPLTFLAAVLGLSVVPVPQAHAAWCIATYSHTTPMLWNLPVADGQWNDLTYERQGSGTNRLLLEGSNQAYCPERFYVPTGKDIKMRCGNGSGFTAVAGGWHSFGGVYSPCRWRGGSIAVSFEIRPNGYW